MVRPTGAMVTGPQRTVAPGQGIYEQSEEAVALLGEELKVGDALFVYSKNGSGDALAAGKMCQASAPVANHLDLACAVAAAGSRTVTVTLGGTAVTADQYADGILAVNAGVGLGQKYRIKSHPAQTSTTGDVVITLYDDIVTALDATSKATLTKHPHDGLLVVPSGGLSAPAHGVPLIPVTASYYFWLQRSGDAPCLTQGSVIIGQPVGLGGTADGACGPIAADTTAAWGVTARVNSSGEYSTITLQL